MENNNVSGAQFNIDLEELGLLGEGTGPQDGSRKRPKVMLLFPPNWTPTMPHLALPTLTAYLRQEGVEVIQRDLNVEVFDEIFSRRYLTASLARLRRMRGSASSGRRQMPGTEKAGAERIGWALEAGPRLAKQVERAKAGIRSSAFYDGPIGLEMLSTLLDCLEIANLPYHPASLHFQGYDSAGPPDNSRFLLHGVRDDQHNMFLDIYRRLLLPDIVREKPDVVGISIPSMAQMLPGLTAAYLVKEAGLDCHVTVGGPHVSMLRAQFPDAPALFELIDSAIVFDGEVPLLQLARAVADGTEPGGHSQFDLQGRQPDPGHRAQGAGEDCESADAGL